jgi:hypothetical protein
VIAGVNEMQTLRVVGLVVVVGSLCGCGTSAPGPPRQLVEPERGYRLDVEPGWLLVGDEVRSNHRSLLSVQVNSLEGADHEFIRGLPDSLLPQLEGWSRHYFTELGAPERRTATIAGIEALELTQPVRARPRDAWSHVVYWVVRRNDRLYTFRGAFPASAPAEDEVELRHMIASIVFTD